MLKTEFFVLISFCSFLSNCDGGRVRESTDEANGKIMFPNDFLLASEFHHHHPGYYSHRGVPPESHRSYNGGDEKADRPYVSHYNPAWEDDDDEPPRSQSEKSNTNSSSQIPLEFIQNINQYNVSDLLLNYVDGDMDYDDPFVVNRFGDDGARNAATIPKAAGCIPELKTITIATSDDPSILYIPQCTRIERCGGCCSHTLLSCQPKKKEMLTYQVMKTQYTGAKKLKFIGKEVVVVEKHISCNCDCKVKEEVLIAHCNKYQEYRSSECRCACTNTDEEKKCYKDSSKRLWNPDLCACQCRDVTQCSTGYSFDQIECRCVSTPVKRRYANYNNRRGYVTETLTVSPLIEDHY